MDLEGQQMLELVFLITLYFQSQCIPPTVSWWLFADTGQDEQAQQYEGQQHLLSLWHRLE